MHTSILSKICKERLNKTAKDGRPYKIYGKDFLIPCEKSPLDTENTIITGWSGTGKTSIFTKPNISSDRNCNYIITIRDDESQDIKNLLPADFFVKKVCITGENKECHFNPLLYLQSRSDVEEFVKSIVFTNHRDLYNGSYSKLEITYLTLLILTARGLYANPLGFNYPNEKYNMLSVVDLADKSFEELETLVNKVMDRFLDDRLAECWDVYTAKLKENFDTIADGQYYMNMVATVLLCNFAIPDNESFYSSDNLHLYDLFDFNRQAVVLDISMYSPNSDMVFVLSVIRILMKKLRFCQYTKFIFDDFQCFAGETYNIEDFFRPRNDCSTDAVVQSLDQLQTDCPETWKTILNETNIIHMGDGLPKPDEEFIKSSTMKDKDKNDLLKNIKILSKNQEAILLKGYGTFIVDKYRKR